jgi:hypothetical protein
MKRLLVIAAVTALAGCGSSDESTANNGANAAAAAKPKKAAYCFFKPEEMKGWTATRDKTGNITVKGKAHVADARYQAQLGPPSVSGTKAEVSPTIAPNTGYEAEGDWWALSVTIPNSAAVDSVAVTCGATRVADLPVPRKS